MATDIQESDTDYHERPASPKRQCTQFVKVNESFRDTEESSNEKEDTAQHTDNIEYDDAETCEIEKLRMWQECQVSSGYMDNFINRVLEHHMKKTSPFDNFRESTLQMVRVWSNMDDSAVLMAIRNHGLVPIAEMVSLDEHCSSPSNYVQGVGNSVATTSADSLRLNNSTDMEGYNGFDSDLDRIDESDQQVTFLERAVAEAIKKKGLRALK